MYDWPEVQAETDRAWAAIRGRLHAAGIDAPERLARRNAALPPVLRGAGGADGSLIASDPADLPPDELDLPALWRHPALLLAQSCWGPMEDGLAAQVTVVGQPDYSLYEGGEGELYSSAVLMRRGEGDSILPPLAGHAALPLGRLRGLRLAFNGPDSMSGLVALARDLESAGEGLAIFSERLETGSHRASIVAVAEGAADLCAVDCRTWHLAKHFEARASDLHAVGWTARRLGLPFITSRHTPPQVVTALRAALQVPSSLASSG